MRLVAFLAAILLTVGVGECLVGLACDRGRRAGGRRAPAQGRGAGGGGGSDTQRQQLRATPAPTTHGPRPHTDLSLLSPPSANARVVAREIATPVVGVGGCTDGPAASVGVGPCNRGVGGRAGIGGGPVGK